MAPKKLWRPVKEWLPHEWAIMNEAWSRVYESLSKDMALTQLDVKAHLLAGRLVGAARVFAPDGIEQCIIIFGEFWQPVELSTAWYVIGWEQHRREGETWRFFVRRRELDRLYPVTAASKQTTTPAAQPAQDDTPPRPKPGQKITKGWRLTAAVELDGFIKEKGRRPSGPELSERVDKKLKYYPDESDVRKLMRFLLDDE